MPYSNLPFRSSVSMITFKDGHFLIVNNKTKDFETWKFPQGGIEDGELAVQAAIREFKEELGSDNLRVVGISEHKNSYHWGEDIINRANKEFKGQEQTFVVMEFLGELHELTPDPKEIEDHRWVHKEEILEYCDDPEHKHFTHYNGLIPHILNEFNL